MFYFSENVPLIPVPITRRSLYIILKRNQASKKTLIGYVTHNLESRGLLKDDSFKSELKKKLSVFLNKFTFLWNKCHRRPDYFEKCHVNWLNGEIDIRVGDSDNEFEKTQMGRPMKNFDDSSNRSKLRKIKPLVDNYSETEVLHAAKVSLTLSGKRDAASMLDQLTMTPTRATKIKKTFLIPTIHPIPYTPEKALALFVNANLTKATYNLIRQQAKLQNSNIYPSYGKILAAKNDCYPAKEGIVITEFSAEIQLQSLLDVTIKRLTIFQQDVLNENVLDIDQLEIIFKWGCDGSSNQKEYKQKFHVEEISDSDLFVISIVPLQFSAKTPGTKLPKILWQNPVASSPRFCRPIKFVMKKETAELTKQEVANIRDQVTKLKPTEILVNNKLMLVKQTLLLTMVDGKVCSSLTNTSSQKCLICKATPKQMNDPQLHRQLSTENYSFGLSTLHCYIRFFECLLHIAYRLDIEKWQARAPAEKESVKNRKNHIFQRFRNELGLIVDQTKQGTGNTNDGNTARRFFQNPDLSAEITNVNVNLIKKFGIILSAMSSGLPINPEKFKVYTLETRNLYLELYPWFYMPSTVHKVLVHGSEIIQHCLLPIGLLSEEAQESRNKDFRNYRERFTRKTSRKDTNQDLLHRLLITSDPIISQVLPSYKKKQGILNSEIRNLLKEPNVDFSSDSELDSD